MFIQSNNLKSITGTLLSFALLQTNQRFYTSVGRCVLAILSAICVSVAPYLIADDGFSGDVRIRYANVDDSINKTATAVTGRLLVGYRSTNWRNWNLNLAIEHVNDFDIHSYNDAGTNGQIQYATEADPSGTELDEGYIQFKNERLQFRYGRQYIDYGKLPQRYIGTASWRQNYQTFDGLTIQGTVSEDLTIDAAVVERAYRVIGRRHPSRLAREFDLDGLAVMATYDSDSYGKLFGYVYNLDFVDRANYSTRTVGLRGETQCLQGFGQIAIPASCDFEYASQSGIGSNPYDNSLTYGHIKVGLNLQDIFSQSPIDTVGIAYSNLEGDGETAFRTPLGSVHGYAGWGDKILINTPLTGLVDQELFLIDNILKWDTKIVYHRFTSSQSVSGSKQRYGSELDAVTSRSFGKYKVAVKLARYRGNKDLSPHPLSIDSSKFWVQVSFSI